MIAIHCGSMAWGLLAGIQATVGLAHMLRFPAGLATTAGRRFVAIAALVVYTVVAVLALGQSPVALWASVGMPLVGVSAVIATGNKIDGFQVVLGIPQGLALVVAVCLWAGWVS